MPKTKDLFLFLLIFIFLLLAIVITIGPERDNSDFNKNINFSGNENNFEYTADHEEKVVDRQSVITRLREALSREDSIIATSPNTEVITSDSQDSDKEESETNLVTKDCTIKKDALTFARTWPKEGVTFSLVGGVRLVSYTQAQETEPVTQVGTTSEEALVSSQQVKALIQLPLLPTKNTEASCLASEIVGVNLEGGLLFNSDAIAYQNRGPGELIGYARDGFPIYGLYNGPTDECGGYELSGSYRYSISTNRTHVLECYRANPQNFIGE